MDSLHFLESSWLSIDDLAGCYLGLFGVLADVGVVIHCACERFINESVGQWERWSNPEEACPCGDTGSCLVGSGLFESLTLLETGCSSRHSQGWGRTKQPTYKNVKSPKVGCNGCSRACICLVPRGGKRSPPALCWGQCVSLGVCVGGQGMRSSRERQTWFILANLMSPPWHRGQGLKEAFGCYLECTKGRESDGIYQRGWCIPGRCPESLLSEQNAACACYSCSPLV